MDVSVVVVLEVSQAFIVIRQDSRAYGVKNFGVRESERGIYVVTGENGPNSGDPSGSIWYHRGWSVFSSSTSSTPSITASLYPIDITLHSIRVPEGETVQGGVPWCITQLTVRSGVLLGVPNIGSSYG